MSSRSRSKKETKSSNTSVNNVFDGDGNVQLTHSDNNTITVTDHGAVDKAFGFAEDVSADAFAFGGEALNQVEKVTDDAFDFGGEALSQVEKVTGDAFDFSTGVVDTAFGQVEKFSDDANDTVTSALAAVKANGENTVAALKEFATQLTVGDIESSKIIALAIVAAVALMAIIYFVARYW